MVRSFVALVLVPAAIVIAAAMAASTGASAVTFAPDAPEDLRALTDETWQQFTEAFAAHRRCIEPVTVRGARRLDDRASYDPGRRLVTVRIPATAANLRVSLVHEFAHHLEFTCPAQERLRGRFLAAQGLPVETPWFDAPAWERTPSEQFAEAATEYVLGHRPAHALTVVTPETVRALQDWAH